MPVKPIVAVLAGAAIALVAEFVLAGWAERNDLAHAIQHGLIFWSGVMIGAGALLMYRQGQRRA